MNKITNYFKQQWSVADRAAAALLLVVFSLLWIKGYPAPYCDDLFFLGAGLSLATGEGLTNPYVQPWLDFYGTQSFLLQPPGHAYLMSVWLRLFGISELSVRLFQWLVLIAGTWFFARYLRQFGVSRVIRLLAGLAYLLAFQRDGLRPEVTAFALMFAGIALLESRQTPARFAAWLLLGYSALCYPITVFASPALIIGEWSFHHRLDRNLWLQTIRRHVVLLSAAVCITLLQLHWMINGQWIEFVRCMTITKGISTPGIGFPNLSWHWINITSNAQVFITMPLYGTALVTTILAWSCRSHFDNRARIITTTLMTSVLLTAAGSPLASLEYCKALCLTITAIGIANVRLIPQALHLPAFAAIIALAHPYFLLGLPFQKIPSQADYQELRSAAQRDIAAGKRLIIDEFSARFIFDYRLPEGALDATCFNTQYLFWRIKEPRMHAVDKSKVGRVTNQNLTYLRKPEDDLWILSEARLLFSVDDFPKEGRKSWPVVTLFGKRFGTVPNRTIQHHQDGLRMRTRHMKIR